MNTKSLLLGALLLSGASANAALTATKEFAHDLQGRYARDYTGKCVVSSTWGGSADLNDCGRLESNALFSFNKSALKPEGRQQLDSVVANLRASNEDAYINIKGYADRIGSANYNKELSEQRAASAKAYLVNKGVPEDRIEIEGRGERRSSTSRKCAGKSSEALKQCLATDRRVDIDISG